MLSQRCTFKNVKYKTLGENLYNKKKLAVQLVNIKFSLHIAGLWSIVYFHHHPYIYIELKAVLVVKIGRTLTAW